MYNKSDKSDSELRFVDKYKLWTLQKQHRLSERISLTMSSRVNDLIAYLSPKYVFSLCNFTENNIYYSFKLCFTMWKFDVYEHILNVLFIWKKTLKYFPGVYFFYLSFKSYTTCMVTVRHILLPFRTLSHTICPVAIKCMNLR